MLDKASAITDIRKLHGRTAFQGARWIRGVYFDERGDERGGERGGELDDGDLATSG